MYHLFSMISITNLYKQFNYFIYKYIFIPLFYYCNCKILKYPIIINNSIDKLSNYDNYLSQYEKKINENILNDINKINIISVINEKNTLKVRFVDNKGYICILSMIPEKYEKIFLSSNINIKNNQLYSSVSFLSYYNLENNKYTFGIRMISHSGIWLDITADFEHIESQYFIISLN